MATAQQQQQLITNTLNSIINEFKSTSLELVYHNVNYNHYNENESVYIFVDYVGKKTIKVFVTSDNVDDDKNLVDVFYSTVLLNDDIIGTIQFDGRYCDNDDEIRTGGIFQFSIETIMMMIQNKDIYISPAIKRK